MAVLLTIPEGWTKELPAFTLWNDGAPYDLTGMTVRLFLRRKGKTLFTSVSGQIRIDADPTTGKVYFKPAETDLNNSHSPYAVRFEVIDQAGDVVFFPNADPDQLVVELP